LPLKTYQQINEKIKSGQVAVVTADEMIDIMAEEGPAQAAEKVDVVTTGTFRLMCSSGAFINTGHPRGDGQTATQPPAVPCQPDEEFCLAQRQTLITGGSKRGALRRPED